MITKTLGELNIYVNDGNYGNIYPEKNEFLCEGVPFISASDFEGKQFNYSGIKYISKKMHENLLIKGHIKKNDILVVVRGNGIGKIGMLKDELEECNINAQLAFIRLLDDEIDADYLYYLLSSDYCFEIIRRFGSGSAQPQLPLNRLMQVPITFDENKEKQRAIGKLLSSLDMKINNNNIIIKELELIAKLIYDYWFLQFDFPNEHGKPYKSSGGKMVWNEELQREIPEGWENGYIKDFIEICNGRDHKELEDGNIPVYGSGGIIRTVNKYLYSGESVLIPRKGTLNNVVYVNEQFWTVDTMFYSILKKVNSGFYTYYSVKLNDFEKLNTGTGVPSMTTAIIYSLKVVIPPDEVLKSFDEKMQAIYGIVKHNRAENRELGQLRDFLLPLLMNGQVGFRED